MPQFEIRRPLTRSHNFPTVLLICLSRSMTLRKKSSLMQSAIARTPFANLRPSILVGQRRLWPGGQRRRLSRFSTKTLPFTIT